jgi:hypothetical protein
LRICHPNEILVFSGKKRKLKDGTVVGYRYIKYPLWNLLPDFLSPPSPLS